MNSWEVVFKEPVHTCDGCLSLSLTSSSSPRAKSSGDAWSMKAKATQQVSNSSQRRIVSFVVMMPLIFLSAGDFFS